MNGIAVRLAKYSIAFLAGIGAVSVDELALTKNRSFVPTALAVRGHPATPLSYAGVARRTTRRAYAAGVASGPRCVRVTDAYGRMITRCY